MFWRNRKKAAKADLEAAQQAARDAAKSKSDAQGKYLDALATAAQARKVNTRNHFSERLTQAFGG